MQFSIEQRVANFKSYYKRQNSRPLLGFSIGSEYPIPRYRASQKLPVDRALLPEDFICQDYLADCDFKCFCQIFGIISGNFLPVIRKIRTA